MEKKKEEVSKPWQPWSFLPAAGGGGEGLRGIGGEGGTKEVEGKEWGEWVFENLKIGPAQGHWQGARAFRVDHVGQLETVAHLSRVDRCWCKGTFLVQRFWVECKRFLEGKRILAPVLQNPNFSIKTRHNAPRTCTNAHDMILDLWVRGHMIYLPHIMSHKR